MLISIIYRKHGASHQSICITRIHSRIYSNARERSPCNYCKNDLQIRPIKKLQMQMKSAMQSYNHYYGNRAFSLQLFSEHEQEIGTTARPQQNYISKLSIKIGI